MNALVDIRSIPKSRTNPQFNRDVLESALPAEGLRYAWMKSLGGLRKGFGKASKNIAWKSKSFRNYADYMETEDFSKGVEELLSLARATTVAIMCAEAVYWRCHRSLVSDYLKSKGAKVIHIISCSSSEEHSYTQCAKIVDAELTYH